MAHDHPLYHRSPPSFLEAYSTRILLGLLCSLAIVLVFFHVPYSNPEGRVGWGPRPSERIPLSEVQHQDESAPEKTKDTERQKAPPQTQHTPAVPDAAPGDAKTETKDREKTEKNPPESDDDITRRVRSIAALSAKDTQPEIVGGRGSLYLEIQYPPAARQEGIEGLLMLHFTVDQEGNARRIDVTKPLHPLCDSAAVEALRSVKFRPGVHDGKPVPVRMSLPVRFQLRSTPKGKGNALRTNRLPSSGN